MLAKNEANDICWLSGLTVSVKSWLTMEMIATELSLWFTLTLSLSSLIIVLPNLKKNSQPEVILHSFKDLLEGYKFWPNPLRISEKAMASHSSTLAWKIPWTEEPGRLQSMGMDWATSLSLFTFMHWIRKWQPTPVFLFGESQGRGAWWAAVYGVAQSRTLVSDFTFTFTYNIIHL